MTQAETKDVTVENAIETGTTSEARTGGRRIRTDTALVETGSETARGTTTIGTGLEIETGHERRTGTVSGTETESMTPTRTGATARQATTTATRGVGIEV